MNKVFLISTILLFLPKISFSEENPILMLEESIISSEFSGTSAHKTARNVRVVTENEMKEKGALSVEDSLRGLPGVYIRKLDGAPPILDLRGTGLAASLTSTILLLNGIPLNGIVAFDMNSIPITEIEKIEIIQGEGALIYGDGASGGVVNIITKSPKEKKYYGNVALEFGSWKTRRKNINYGMKIGNRLLLKTSYSEYSTMDYRDRYHGTDWKGESFDYRNQPDKRYSFWINGKYILENGNIDLHYTHMQSKDIFTSSLDKKSFEKNPKQMGNFGKDIRTTADVWNLSYHGKFKNHLDFSFYTGCQYQKNIKQKQSTAEYFSKAQLKYAYGSDSHLILGGDFKKRNREMKERMPLTRERAPNDTRESIAAYFLNTFSLQNWKFTQGYRMERVNYEYTEKTYDPFWNLIETKPVSSRSSKNDTIELGLNYLYSDTGNVYFNFTKAMRTPTIGDMEAWQGEVETKRTNTLEFGIRDYFINTLFSSSFFYSIAKKEVHYDKSEAFKVKTRNFDGKIRRVGLQLSLQHYLGNLSLRENISFINPKIITGEYAERTYPAVPNWIVNLGATYHFSEKFLLNADVYHQSKAYAEEDFHNSLGKDNSYTTFHIHASYRWDSGIEIYGGIKNLLSEKYADTISKTKNPMNGNLQTIYYPADGRNIYMGFRYKF